MRFTATGPWSVRGRRAGIASPPACWLQGSCAFAPVERQREGERRGNRRHIEREREARKRGGQAKPEIFALSWLLLAHCVSSRRRPAGDTQKQRQGSAESALHAIEGRGEGRAAEEQRRVEASSWCLVFPLSPFARFLRVAWAVPRSGRAWADTWGIRATTSRERKGGEERDWRRRSWKGRRSAAQWGFFKGETKGVGRHWVYSSHGGPSETSGGQER